MSTHSQIIEILKELENSDCEEFHLRIDGMDLSLRRRVGPATGASYVPRPAPEQFVEQPRDTGNSSSSEKAPDSAKQSTEPAPLATETAPNGEISEIKAPMSGTFFRRPAPDEPPFVEVGDHIKAGDPVCMIEVMKLFSTIYADFPGRVVSFAVGDGEAVSQDQPLIAIQPE